MPNTKKSRGEYFQDLLVNSLAPLVCYESRLTFSDSMQDGKVPYCNVYVGDESTVYKEDEYGSMYNNQERTCFFGITLQDEVPTTKHSDKDVRIKQNDWIELIEQQLNSVVLPFQYKYDFGSKTNTIDVKSIQINGIIRPLTQLNDKVAVSMIHGNILFNIYFG